MAAQIEERPEILDLELMDRIDLHSPIADFAFAGCASRPYLSGLCRVPSSSVGPAMRPAERITLSTPAAKPSKRNTMSPQGEMPSQRSISQPMPAPTTTPATSSLETRKPLA